jgi:hypothetical protein
MPDQLHKLEAESTTFGAYNDGLENMVREAAIVDAAKAFDYVVVSGLCFLSFSGGSILDCVKSFDVSPVREDLASRSGL